MGNAQQNQLNSDAAVKPGDAMKPVVAMNPDAADGDRSYPNLLPKGDGERPKTFEAPDGVLAWLGTAEVPVWPEFLVVDISEVTKDWSRCEYWVEGGRDRKGDICPGLFEPGRGVCYGCRCFGHTHQFCPGWDKI